MNKILDKYPVENKNQIKEAQNYFSENIMNFSPSDRVKIAKQMYATCVLNKVPMDKHAAYNTYFDFVVNGDTKVASMNYLKSNIDDRKALVDGMTMKDNEKLASDFLDEVLKTSEQLPVSKVAELIETFDNNMGIATQWDDSIRDPYTSITTSNVTFGKNSFSKIAHNMDIFDVHNLSCNDNLAKEASKSVDQEVVDRFRDNPFNFLAKENGISKNAFLKVAENFIEA